MIITRYSDGKYTTHWRTTMQISQNNTVEMLLDTGSSISTVNSISLETLYKMFHNDFSNYIRSTSLDLQESKLANSSRINLYGIYLRNVIIGGVFLPSIKLYTSIDSEINNLIGMDIIRCCELYINGDYGSCTFDLEKYNPNISGCCEIKSLLL